MKIRFTITLSDETVDAFKTTGSADGETIKNCMVSELRAFFARVKGDAEQMAAEPDDEEEDDEEDDEEIPDEEPEPAPKKKPARKKATKK